MIDREAILDLLAEAPRARVAVVGDFVLDRNIYGRPIRLSREAPIPVLAEEGEEGVPGGAGNTAANIASLGARVEALGILGDDPEGERLVAELRRRGIMSEGVFVSKGGYLTPRKTRILAGERHSRKNQMLRLERNPISAPSTEILERLAARVGMLAGAVQAVVVADHGFGAVTGPVLESIRSLVGRVPVVADSRRRLLEFRHVTAITVNEPEAIEAAGVEVEDPVDAATRIFERTGASHVVLTQGNHGMVIVDASGRTQIEPVGPPYSVDGTGAGETVAGTIALGLALGAGIRRSAQLAACAAGVVVMKPGTATVTAAELRDAVRRWS